MKLTNVLVVTLGLLATGCSHDEAPAPTSSSARPSESWIRGDVDERFARVAKHLRGFDVAMMETGARYIELYWAGQDNNWGYAAYQLEKIETAVGNGIERRPKRAASAAMLAPALAGVRAAVERSDEAAFASAFATLTQTCNACHVAEQVPFIQVAPPTQRHSPVVPRSGSGSDVPP
jgi:cytochrome c556